MKSPLLIGLFALSALSLGAQPSATMRPSLLATVTSSLGYSSNEALTYRNAPVGQISVSHWNFSLSDRHAIDADRAILYGLAYQSHELNSTIALLPDNLTELSLNLGWQQTLSPKWSLGAYLRPGFYGELNTISGDSFNMPALFLANYAQSRQLIWSFGLNTNPFSDNPVLPILGVRWQFAPAWTFNVGFPQSGFTWQTSETVSLRAGVGFQGGSFRQIRNLGVPAPGVNRLANTFLDYREIQAGVGADIKITPTLRCTVDVGAVTDRKFDYFDREFRLDGDTGFYASVSLKASF